MSLNISINTEVEIKRNVELMYSKELFKLRLKNKSRQKNKTPKIVTDITIVNVVFNILAKKKFNFFVSPSTIKEIVIKKPINYIPGAETISEFNYLYNLGYKVIRFFTTTLYGRCKKLKFIETIFMTTFSI